MSKWRQGAASSDSDEAFASGNEEEDGQGGGTQRSDDDDDDDQDDNGVFSKKSVKVKKKSAKKAKKRRDDHAEDSEEDALDGEKKPKNILTKTTDKLTGWGKAIFGGKDRKSGKDDDAAAAAAEEAKRAKKDKKKAKKEKRARRDRLAIYADPTHVFEEDEKFMPDELLSHANPCLDGSWQLDVVASDGLEDVYRLAGFSGAKALRRAMSLKNAWQLRIKTGSLNKNIDYVYTHPVYGSVSYRLPQDARVVHTKHPYYLFVTDAVAGGMAGASRGTDVDGGAVGVDNVEVRQKHNTTMVYNMWSDSIPIASRWVKEVLPPLNDSGCSLITVYKYLSDSGDVGYVKERKFLSEKGKVLSVWLEIHCKDIDAYDRMRQEGQFANKKSCLAGCTGGSVPKPLICVENREPVSEDDGAQVFGHKMLKVKLYYRRAESS